MEAGLPSPSSIHTVSSLKQLGIRDLLKDLQASAGAAGDIWVVNLPPWEGIGSRVYTLTCDSIMHLDSVIDSSYMHFV